MSETTSLRPLAGLKLRQHVNLFTAHFTPKQVPFSASFMLIYAVALVLAIAGFSSLLKRNDGLAQAHLLQSQAALARDQQALDGLRASMKLDQTGSVEKEITRLEQEIRDRQAILAVLDNPLHARQVTPAQTFSALANASRAGIWLTHIQTDSRDKTVLLEGGTLNAGILPSYIDMLNRQTAFQDARFRMFRVEEPAAGKSDMPAQPYLQFRLGSGIATPETMSLVPVGDRPS